MRRKTVVFMKYLIIMEILSQYLLSVSFCLRRVKSQVQILKYTTQVVYTRGSEPAMFSVAPAPNLWFILA